jgi:hypothetical protein
MARAGSSLVPVRRKAPAQGESPLDAVSTETGIDSAESSYSYSYSYSVFVVHE